MLDIFLELLKREEGPCLDFKAEHYDFSVLKKKVDFFVDIVAMANTPRETSAYIVFGVDKEVGNPPVLVGLQKHLDDSIYMDILASGNVVNPYPEIEYHVVRYENNDFGVLEIKVSNGGPFQINKKFNNYSVDKVIYHRVGSCNIKAIPRDIVRISKWFDGSCAMEECSTQLRREWDIFYDSAGQFSTEATYSLILEDRIEDGDMAGFGYGPWSLVLDFDPNSENGGAFDCIKESLEDRKTVRIATIGDSEGVTRSGCCWCYPAGLVGRADTEFNGSTKEWKLKYKKYLSDLVSFTARKLLPSVHYVLVVWGSGENKDKIRQLLDLYTDNFGQHVVFLFVNDRDLHLRGLSDEFESKSFDIGIASVSSGLLACLSRPIRSECLTLPGGEGQPVQIEKVLEVWINESFQVWNLNLEIDVDEEPNDFRKGGEISWSGLHLRYDCDRTKYKDFYGAVSSQLYSRSRKRFTIYHSPGAGGTTLARRLAWDLHSQYPTLWMTSYERDTSAAILDRIAAVTGSAVLVVVDSVYNDFNKLDGLFNELSIRQVPCIIVQVVREYGNRDPSEFFIKSALDSKEASSFYHKYSTARPSKKAILKTLLTQVGTSCVSPFIFGLSAYEDEFLGIEEYVKSRISNLTPEQIDILCFLAMANYYGQLCIPISAIKNYFSIIHGNLKSLFSNSSLTLELIVEERPGYIRPLHYLISEKLLHVVLGNKEFDWRYNLDSWACKFVSFLDTSFSAISEEAAEIACRMFIFRGNKGESTAISSDYSRLIEEIPEKSGKKNVFDALTNVFTEEAHFHAHYGRLCADLGDFDESIEHLEKALSLSPHDSRINHMFGISHRDRVKYLQENHATLEEMLPDMEAAASFFKQSRELDDSTEHAFISEIEMLIAAVDYASRSIGCSPTELVRKTVSNFYRTALESAETLLYGMESKGKESDRVVNCKSKIRALYSDYPSALSLLDSALNATSRNKAPIRRQIVYTLLHKNNDSWKNLSSKDMSRAYKLLDDNLIENPSDVVSLRLWIRGIRYVDPAPSLNAVYNKVCIWRATSGSLDSYFYSYIISFLLHLDGSTLAKRDVVEYLAQCKQMSTFRQYRVFPIEWLGCGGGIQALVHFKELPGIHIDDIQKNRELLRLEGRVKDIRKPQQGTIDFKGFNIFFNPGISGVEKNRDENKVVTFICAFTYDGIVARDVCLKD